MSLMITKGQRGREKNLEFPQAKGNVKQLEAGT